MSCAECGAPLTRDEIGLTRKLISRAATRCFCKTCLGRQFRLSRAQLDALAERFRAAGCSLFT